MIIKENISPIKRLEDGVCPVCLSKLDYISNICNIGKLDNNGAPDTSRVLNEDHVVVCYNCGYQQDALQLGLRIIPIDRIVPFDKDWDKKYLEDNIIINGEPGKNPFIK